LPRDSPAELTSLGLVFYYPFGGAKKNGHMSDFVLTRTGSVIDFRPMEKGSWALAFSKGSWSPWAGMPGDLLGSRPLSEKEAIELTSPGLWLAESIEATFDLLVEFIHDSKIMVSMLDCYKYYFKMYGEKRDIKPRKIEQDDIDRLFFEILCFATFHIVVRGAPGCIKGKLPAESRLSGNGNIRLFNQRLLERLEKFLAAHEITAVKELVIAKTKPAVKYGTGESLNAAKRMASYLKAGSIEEELRIFSHYAGSAMDPRSLQITEIIGLSHTGMILDIISRTLEAVFEK
jgi:hypothetical protein